ncbi:Heterokaryon incompatibility protein (HET) domain containing protein [Rhypophila decipiens]
MTEERGPDDKLDVWVGERRDTLRITRNLAAALRQFTEETTHDRVFWIDVICINQEDLEERSQQVRLMTQIYTKASRVVAWIGPGSQASTRTMKNILDLSESIDLDWRVFEITSRSAKPSIDVVTDILSRPDGMSDLEELLFRAWFERLWVWQEIRVASDRAIVKCGQEETAWNDFHKAIFAIRTTSNGSFSKATMRQMAVVVQMKNMASSTSLVSLSSWTRRAKCTDDRDRIYAVQGMIQRSEAALIEPDYTRPVDDIYMELAGKYITQLKSLALLTCCRYDLRKTTLPTWVPNWSGDSERKFGQIMNPDASGASACEATLAAEGGVLRLQGNHCDVVERTYQMWDVAPETDVVASILHIAGQLGVGADDRVIERTTLEDLGITFELESVAEDFELMPRGHLLRIQQAKEFLQQILSGEPLQFLRKRAQRWQIQGSIGLSPVEIQPGDIPSVLLGAKSLMMLRQRGDGKHEGLGECYVHGMMRAQALLGPVPEGWRRVAKLDGKMNSYHACWKYQAESGAFFQTTDPRLGPLPDGWELKPHENEDSVNYYRNPTTGEGMAIDIEKDPRLLSERLLEGGVEIVAIDLV